MRTLLMTAALVSVASLRAWAQGVEDDEGANDISVTEGGATIIPDKAPSRRPPASTGRVSAPGTQHTVERGDTLWDLSQKFLGSPWYWPKVWSYNPEIANPHWIYPGNEVRFFGTGEEVPMQVDVGPQETEAAMPETPEDRVAIFGTIGFQGKAQTISSPGFVTNKEVEEAGRIVGSFAESEMLSGADRLYVQFSKKAPRLGETYLVFRSAGEVTHPVTGNSVGFQTNIVAEAKVVRVDSRNMATMSIAKQYDEVLRGDLLGPSEEPVARTVAPRPSDREIKDAYVVADVRRYPTTLGEHSLAIMDKGSDHGVRMGTVFTIYRQHDPLPQEALLQPTVLEPQFPQEDIGQCVAFEVKASASICLITHSIREIIGGDHAEVRAVSNPRAAALR